jgi:hypothetical protein
MLGIEAHARGKISVLAEAFSGKRKKQTRFFLSFKLGRAPVAFAPLGLTQIDSAQQRSQLLRRDLAPQLAAVCPGYRVGAFFQAFRPQREAVAIPIQNLEAVAESRDIVHPFIRSLVA